MKTWERLNEETKQHSWLEIGAWNHFFQICLEGKEVLHPQNEEIPKMLEWFELTLKQKEIPTQRIRAYEIGADRWIDIVSDRLGEEGTAGNMTLYLDEKALRADAPEREKRETTRLTRPLRSRVSAEKPFCIRCRRSAAIFSRNRTIVRMS